MYGDRCRSSTEGVFLQNKKRFHFGLDDNQLYDDLRWFHTKLLLIIRYYHLKYHTHKRTQMQKSMSYLDMKSNLHQPSVWRWNSASWWKSIQHHISEIIKTAISMISSNEHDCRSKLECKQCGQALESTLGNPALRSG